MSEAENNRISNGRDTIKRSRDTRHAYGTTDPAQLHTFVVCAYKESPYLQKCVASLMRQNAKSRILIATSTPNEWIRRVAKRYGLEVRVNRSRHLEETTAAGTDAFPDDNRTSAMDKTADGISGGIMGGTTDGSAAIIGGIANDWNFALAQADTPLITLAHQDDVYHPAYAEQVIRAYERSRARRPIILFTDYRELRPAQEASGESDLSVGTRGTAGSSDSDQPGSWRITESGLIRTKRLMSAPLTIRPLQQSRFIRRRILSFGNAICCPSVTYVRERLPEGGALFTGEMKSNIDWQAWEQLSRETGAFLYISRPLMLHRIHEDSTTAGLVQDHARREEDLYMFRKFWPGKIPELIWKAYGKNEQYQ